ncbi:helix-turn-helix domain-containing protein [Streptomyces bacillaris]|uniref:helix-turn-helix domain-containing protein n=1 Tax=Streptomyces bacillaris TaxID=68179 RepID=UPI0036763908
MARERSGRTAQHLVLAARLRHLREGAGLSVPQAAKTLGWHPSTLRRLERAETSLDVGQVGALLELYGASAGEREDIMGRPAVANAPGWWHPRRDAMDPWLMDVMSVESAAGVVRPWDPAPPPRLARSQRAGSTTVMLIAPGAPALGRQLRLNVQGRGR